MVKEKHERSEFEYITYQETLTKGSKSLRSPVWEDFKRLLDVEENIVVNNFALCFHCKGFIAFNGKTTSQLLAHKAKCTSNPLSMDQLEDSRIIFKQAELAELRDAAAKFVVKDFRPFYALEGDGLIDLLYAIIQLALRYQKMTRSDIKKCLPSRNTIANHIRSLAEKATVLIRYQLRAAIEKSGGFAVTADAGTEQFNSTPLLSLTAHILREGNTSLHLDVFTIDVHEIQDISHTGLAFRRAILEIFSKLGINEEEVKKYVCFVTDRGPNIRLAVADFENEACVAHLYNNVVGCMIDTSTMKTIIKDASKLVRFVKVSHIGTQLVSRLKQYVSTRWNTAHDMLKSIYENHRELEQLLEAKELASSRRENFVEKLTCLPIQELKPICEFLSFFKDMTTALEGDQKVTLHRVWPALRELKHRLQANVMDCDTVAKMKDAGRIYVRKNENEKFFEPSMRHKIALFLHPEYRKMDFMNYFGKSFITVVVFIPF